MPPRLQGMATAWCWLFRDGKLVGRAETNQAHLAPIDGLRCGLALWVALDHGFQTSGYVTLKGPLAWINRGSDAVAVFMIVSGFVIAQLLMRGGETYGQFITRRFFRLYPIYVVCCVFSLCVSGLRADVMHHVPWRSLAPLVDSISHQTAVLFWPHVAAHAVMLHGAIPNEILPHSALTILGPAWSISLEWQFYLVAPLVFVMLKPAWRLAGLLAVVAAFYVLFRKGYLGTYDAASSLAGSSPWFAVGIASRLAYDRLRQWPLPALPVSALAVVGLVLLPWHVLPLMIWAPFYAFLVWGGASRAGAVFSLVTTNPVSLVIGSASYSLYLIHQPAQTVAAWLALRARPQISQHQMLAVQMGAILVAVLVALVLRRFIEKPGIELGRWLANGGSSRPWPASSPAQAPSG